MPVITIEGQIGSGASELGKIVAAKLGIDFIDRLVLSQIARRLGSITVNKLDQFETLMPSFIDRITANIEKLLARSALSGVGGDPYFGPGVEHLFSKSYYEFDEERFFLQDTFDEKQFFNTTKEVIFDVAQSDNVVIIGRGGNIITKSIPGVLNIGLSAAIDFRKASLIKSEGVNDKSALEMIAHADRAQKVYFSKAFNESPTDPVHYHVMFNTKIVDIEKISDCIAMIVKARQAKIK